MHPLETLSPVERASILAALLQAHPSLVVEAEGLAARSLDGEDRHAVSGDLAHELRALHLSQLAERAGPQWGGGYVDPNDAADELLAEAVQPHLDDLHRRVRVGARVAAQEIGFGLLLGLYSCRGSVDDELVLTHAGMPDVVDNLASKVIAEMDTSGLDLPDDWLTERCPEWTR